MLFLVPFSWQFMVTVGSGVLLLSRIHYKWVRMAGFRSGQTLSYYMSRLPGWESYCEPLLCRQLSRFFIFGNALLDGLGSDNMDRTVVDDILRKCRLEIGHELEHCTNLNAPTCTRKSSSTSGSPLYHYIEESIVDSDHSTHS